MKLVIIDNNLICSVIGGSSTIQLTALSNAFLYGEGCTITAVLGGRLETEYYGHTKYIKTFAELIRSGRIRKIPSPEIDALETSIAPSLKSDDPHVVALALISGARVLCSHDSDLHDDFTNPDIISKPRGKVWQSDNHQHLLRR